MSKGKVVRHSVSRLFLVISHKSANPIPPGSASCTLCVVCVDGVTPPYLVIGLDHTFPVTPRPLIVVSLSITSISFSHKQPPHLTSLTGKFCP
ncbi:hypothetical protein M501DRAFT_557708 [Patellaria atrata CBS 101060]|uniref:Uncharacterized protein n=1 Tax=Patellaria atrata CBS 101060 TaxID=1346257 RepID=A0A9P4VTZ8_9PEZI|nr:hypothetical protein M501DRAFT_557708 [Patellaria atrata CBS 101060]